MKKTKIKKGSTELQPGIFKKTSVVQPNVIHKCNNCHKQILVGEKENYWNYPDSNGKRIKIYEHSEKCS